MTRRPAMSQIIHKPDVQIFHGDGSAAGVRVYARLIADHPPGNVTLSGTLEGPFSRSAHTMTARYLLASQGCDPCPLAATTIPEACPWTPEAPYVYHARIEVRRGDELLAIVKRSWGWRPLAVRGSQLVWEGRPWVVRGWRLPQFPAGDLDRAPWDFSPWRGTATAYCGPADDGLCEYATTFGVVIVAEIPDDAASIANEVKRLAQWSAVAMIVLPASAGPIGELRRLAPSTLLAVRPDLCSAPGEVEADVMIYQAPHEMSQDELLRNVAARQASCPTPVIGYRPAGECDGVAAARAECDRLQRDLAGQGQFVGYLV